MANKRQPLVNLFERNQIAACTLTASCVCRNNSFRLY